MRGLGVGWAIVVCSAVDAGCIGWPGCAPGGAVPFFVSPKKGTKERRPQVCDPCAALRGRPAPQAQPQGVENHTGHRCARPRFRCLSRPSAAMARMGFSHPSGRAEKRRAWGGHGQRSMPMLRALTCCGCLSEVRQRAASSAAPPRARASQVARSEAKGHGQWGRLLCSRNFAARSERTPIPTFAYFLLATQKKVSALPGAHPGQQAPEAPAASA